MSSSLRFIDTTISNLKIIERNVFKDNRGFFFRVFAKEELEEIGLNKPIIQINVSHSNKKHTTRGLHFQFPPYAETKIVTCLTGAIFDVAIDLRKDSPTFLNWFGVILSSENNRSLFIPVGFAHGFQTITEESELLYLHTETYVKESEGGLHILDPRIGIQWPHLPVNLSDRDNTFAFLNNNFIGIDSNEM